MDGDRGSLRCKTARQHCYRSLDVLCTHVSEFSRHILSNASLLLYQAAGLIVLEEACCFLRRRILLDNSETSYIGITFMYVILAIDTWRCCVCLVVCGIGLQKRQDSIATAKCRDFDLGVPAVMLFIRWHRRQDHPDG